MATPNTNTRIQRVELEVRNNLKRFFGMTKESEIILDGPAGTGKTRVLLERQHLIMNKYPMARGLVTRKFRSSMNETVLEVLDNEVFRNAQGDEYPDAPQWHERDQKYVYANGSEIVVAGMDDPTKILSSKYDWFYWNESIEASRSAWESIMSRLRNFRVPYQQALGDTNPGPPTHWINQMALAGKIVRLPTTHKDNPVYWDEKRGVWTAKGEMYVNKILRDSLTGLRYKRLYEGKWVAAEGQVYPMFDPKVHVIPRRPLPSSWPRYWVFDFGYIDPFVWIELVENPDTGQLILHRELYHTQMRVADAAQLIREKSFLQTTGQPIIPYALICDHDSENRATLEKELGFLTLPAFKSIHPGIQGVQARLKVDKKWSSGNNEVPGFVIMENANIKTDPDLLYRHKPTCTVEEWEGYVWDTGKMSMDKYKDDPVDKDNHGMDVIRYGVGFVDSLSIDPQEASAVVNYNDLDDNELEQHWNDTAISQF
jgi:phage terminase large subunit